MKFLIAISNQYTCIVWGFKLDYRSYFYKAFSCTYRRVTRCLKAILFTPVIVLFLAGELFPQNDTGKQVRIGQYTVNYSHIYTSNVNSEIHWHATAENDTRSFSLQIKSPGSENCRPVQMWEQQQLWTECREVENGAIVTLHYSLSLNALMQQRNHSLYEKVGKPECAAVVNLQGGMLTVSSNPDIDVKRIVDSLLQGNAGDGLQEEFHGGHIIQKARAVLLTKMLADPIADSLCSFLKLFRMLPDTLAMYCLYDSIPEIFSKNSNGKYVPLVRSDKKYHGMPEVYELDKSDGDAAELKLFLKTKVYTVTANGISSGGKKGGETDIRIRIRQYGVNVKQHEFVTTFSTEGIALVRIPKLIGSTMLVVDISDKGHQGSRSYTTCILLRGKNTSLDTLPLYMPKPGNPKSAAKVMLVEMNNMFDPDRNGWYGNNSGYDYLVKPDTYVLKVLSGFSHGRFPNLEKITLTKDTLHWVVNEILPYRYGGTFTKECTLDSIINFCRNLSAGLAEPLAGDTDKGWHNPETVFRVAILCRDMPQVCSGLPLKNILDFWCSVLPSMPVPLKRENYGKGYSRIVKDTDPYSIVYAIAALKTGARIFRDTTYSNAVDLLHMSFRTAMDSVTRYYADHPVNDFFANRSKNNYIRWVNAYGQVGLLTNNKEVHTIAKDLLIKTVYDKFNNRNSAIRDMFKETSFFDKTLLVMNLLHHSIENVQFPYSVFTPCK